MDIDNILKVQLDYVHNSKRNSFTDDVIISFHSGSVQNDVWCKFCGDKMRKFSIGPINYV